jgi:D-lyxose ketol-isomerase
MKRSEINNYIREAKDFISAMHFALPPFAFWSPDDWKTKGAEYDEIRQNQLGWDLTDFGSGYYEKTGLFLFTIRNGNTHNPRDKKTYAEKILVVKPGQVTPYHYHASKMEDIINRGGKGLLRVQVYGSLGPKELSFSQNSVSFGRSSRKSGLKPAFSNNSKVAFPKTDVLGKPQLDKKAPIPVAVDGRHYTVPPGTIIKLAPGESISLFQGVFHQFWCDDAVLLLGEVSMVNDDHADNFFLEDRGRFPAIDEDEKPLHLLVGDYA